MQETVEFLSNALEALTPRAPAGPKAKRERGANRKILKEKQSESLIDSHASWIDSYLNLYLFGCALARVTHATLSHGCITKV